MISTSALVTSRRVFALVFAVFMLTPLTIVLVTSFTAEAWVRFPPQSFGLTWYYRALTSSTFMPAFLFSLQTASAVAAISGVMGVLAALVLARTMFAGRETIIAFLMMPLALPHIVLAIALLQLFGQFGIASSPYGLVTGHVLITLPYVLRMTMTSLVGLDPLIERASYSLGASVPYTLWRVTLPMIAPGALAGVVFAFLLSFDEVTISLFTALPGRATLPAEIFNYASQGSDPIIAAVSGLMIIITSVLMILVERFFGVLRLIANEK